MGVGDAHRGIHNLPVKNLSRADIEHLQLRLVGTLENQDHGGRIDAQQARLGQVLFVIGQLPGAAGIQIVEIEIVESALRGEVEELALAGPSLEQLETGFVASYNMSA